MKKIRKVRTLIIAAAMFLLTGPVLNLSASGISEAQREKEALQQELEAAQELIDGLEDSKADIATKVQQLDAQLTDISVRINELEVQLDEKSTEIDLVEEELEEAQAEERAQYEQMKQRIKYMYENSSNTSMLETLLTAGSFAEFISRAEYVKQITEYDRRMLEKYRMTQQTVVDTKTALETDYAQLEELKSQVEEEQEAVSSLVAAKEQELARVTEDISAAENEADVVAAEIQAQDEIIAQIQAEEARKAEERRIREEEAARRAEEAKQQELSSEQPAESEPETEPEEAPYSGGAFVWPCPSSTRITSDYGGRLSPASGASSNHKGIDIGAAYGAAIVAAADGVVTYAGYGSATGNYIMLSHGSGVYTIYCHCSALLVSSGTTVSAGQTIAQVGSTGISTGNHLHFGVTNNGTYVSPWNYLSR